MAIIGIPSIPVEFYSASISFILLENE